ncbi:MAG: hypothetical protein JWO85_573 [Candidatus Eremiobacteraeota bacterium]|nr:hypothetical protein [Candidatus Eremiobacteraeota bacterium]
MNASSTTTQPASPTLQEAWSATCQIGKALRIEKSTLVVEVAVDDNAAAIDRLNLYRERSFLKMHRAGFIVTRVVCKNAAVA